MKDESSKLMNKKNKRLLLVANAVGLAGFALMISAMCWLWLRYTIIREVRADDRGEMLFMLVNTHALSLLAGWLILFFALFFRGRLEVQAGSEYVQRVRRISYGLAFILAVVIPLQNLVIPGLIKNGIDKASGGIAIEGVELAAPMNASVKRDASPTRPVYEFTTNAYGFRDRQIEADADKNKKRIMLVGDSFIFGSGIAQNECLNPILENELNGRLYGRDEVRVYSVAQEGWNLEQEVSAIIAMSPLTRPDIVLVSHMPGNDLWPRDPMFCDQWQNGIFRDVLFEMRARQIEYFRDKEYTHADLVENYHRQLQRLTDWALTQGVDVLFFTYGICTYQIEKYLESGRIFVQHFPEWSLDRSNMIEGDGHPTGQGNSVMARLLSPYVIEMLQLRDNEKSSGFSLKSRLSMQSMWPKTCGPLGHVAYEKIWVIPQDKTTLIRDLVAAEWLEQHKLQHLNTVVDESAIRMTFADAEKKQFNAIMQKYCATDNCRACADACICFENAVGDTAELQNYICSRLPKDLWDQKDRPIENNPRTIPKQNDGDTDSTENSEKAESLR